MMLLERVRRTVRTYGLVPRGGRVLVGVSGGPDSVALAHLLVELAAAGDLSIVGLAHYNHQLRGVDAEADEAFCIALAGRLGLPVELGRGDVRAAARAVRRSVEDVARELRYSFLGSAAGRLGAEAIAVGHTLEDQAETFLLRLIRGAGPRGLGGIRPKAGRVVRPLIDLRRADLRAYLSERGLAFREDASNADLSIPRNRVRHRLIPYLEEVFSPGISRVLAREARIAARDEDRLAAEAIDLAGSVVLRASEADGAGARVKIDVAALASLHPALAARVALGALETGGRSAGFDQVERFLEFARSASPGAVLSLPGQRAVCQGAFVVLGLAPSRTPPAGGANSFRVSLSIPGEVVLPAQGWVVSAAECRTAPEETGALTARVLASAVQAPLLVRSRLPGDRLRPAGMGGRRKKLQDLFVDRKVPRAERDAVPLVVDAAGRIVWVVGGPVGEEFRPLDPSAGVILLKARRLPPGEPGAESDAPSGRPAGGGGPG